jgi:hypothetical protein
MAQVINITYQLKRGNSSRWIELNPILKQGEPGFEIDTGKLKVGNGISTWTELPYIGDSAIINVSSKQELPEIGDINYIYRVIEESNLYQWTGSDYKTFGLSETELVNVNNLVQDDGDYLILYGGSATENI